MLPPGPEESTHAWSEKPRLYSDPRHQRRLRRAHGQLQIAWVPSPGRQNNRRRPPFTSANRAALDRPAHARARLPCE
jgi:hypothetical protein